MKKVSQTLKWILLYAAIAIFCNCLLITGAYYQRKSIENSEYPLCGKVVKVNKDENYFCIEDFNGNIWEVSISEDWMVGDFCAMIMDNQGTPQIQDDIIKQCHYCGYEE